MFADQARTPAQAGVQLRRNGDRPHHRFPDWTLARAGVRPVLIERA